MIFIAEVTVLYFLLKLSELSCSECSICLGLAVHHLPDVLLLSSEWELAALMYLSTQCSSSLIGLR